MGERLIDPLPQFISQVDNEPGQPRGLLDELLEQKVVSQDFVTPEHTYQVLTQLICERNSSLFRCVVTQDGEELSAQPWAVIFEDLEAELRDQGLSSGEPATCRELAHRALEEHLQRCAQVGEALERDGRLVRPSGWNRSKYWVLAAVVVATVAGAGAAWRFHPQMLEDLWNRAFQEADLQPEGLGAPSPEQAPTFTAFSQPENAGDDRPQSAESSSPPERFAINAKPVHPARGPASQPREPAPAEPKSETARRPPKSHGVEEKPQDASESSSASTRKLEQLSEVTPTTTRAGIERNPEAIAVHEWSWPVSLSSLPSVHSKLQLAPGEQVYFQDNLRLVRVPQSLRGLRCVTTRDAAGEAGASISLRLTEPTRVVIAFDERVKRRPSWLAPFRQSTATVTAIDPDRNDTFTYLIFEKDLPAGRLSLGENSAASKVFKRLRSVARRTTLMYLVCVPEIPTSSRTAAP